MNDKYTTVQELKNLLADFRDARDWKQFHDPKNLAEAISIEAAELQELFLWKDKNDVIQKVENDPVFRERVGEELADVINFCLNFANATGLDIAEVVKNKVAKSDKKYPVEKAKGTSAKYSEL